MSSILLFGIVAAHATSSYGLTMPSSTQRARMPGATGEKATAHFNPATAGGSLYAIHDSRATLPEPDASQSKPVQAYYALPRTVAELDIRNGPRT